DLAQSAGVCMLPTALCLLPTGSHRLYSALFIERQALYALLYSIPVSDEIFRAISLRLMVPAFNRRPISA
ncbi:MAG: hypothetical protein NTY44_08370, partial [Deltaproteobacteria bacterium]|nr:hypothetical protein [Deltaproteobacteria bacterium]